MLGAREDEHLLPFVAADEMGEQVALAVFRDEMHRLLHELGRCIAARDFHLGGIVQQSVRELAYLFREGRGEHEVLALRRQHREDAADVGMNPMSSMLVGFVEHENFHARQVERLLPQ